ncbi:MAG: BadF/BadG/BcrA/BcrD ATPase family protein [Gordonia sp. (in: high G+C Gram-positive bacteria)]
MPANTPLRDARRLLIVDGGQTGTRVRIVTGNTITGRSVTDHDAEPIRTDRPVVEQIADITRRLLHHEPVVESVLLAGLTGLTPQGARTRELLGLTADVGVESVRLAHDSVSAYLAANALEFGVTTAVGTGVVTLGVGPSGLARVDGWGNIVGDAGSAYWIGRAGIDAALRAFDGRGPRTDLSPLAVAEFGPLPEVYMVLQSDPYRVRRIAAFARTVAERADSGDASSVAIIDAAAQELAISVAAAAHRSGTATNSPRISWIGAVLAGNALLHEKFVTAVHARLPGARVEKPLGSTLDGVQRLIDITDEHPLYSEIHHAPAK